MARFRFLLLHGRHGTGQGKDRKQYKKGDVFESDTDLNKIFDPHGLKFQKVGHMAITTDGDPKKAELRPKPKPTALEVLGDPAALQAAAEKGAGVQGTNSDSGGDEEDTDLASGLGDDVTSSYPSAKLEDLVVLKKGKDFFVADKASPNKALNEKPLKKAGVEKFIAEYVKPQDDEE